MTREALLTLLVLAIGVGWAVVSWTRRKRSGSPDGDWGVLTRCATCRASIPRWFLLDKGSPRGAYGRYRYPIPPSCRVCRGTAQASPPARWRPGESEWEYDERADADERRVVAEKRR